MAAGSGLCEYFTYTSVPPRKSTPNGMPCQNSMEAMPAKLNTSEKARKYHFLPRKSMLVLRNNSIPTPVSNTQRLATLLPAQHPVKNYPRNKHCRKQIRRQTKHQRGGKPSHWPGTENKQDRR